jgi:hypothetical protein
LVKDGIPCAMQNFALHNTRSTSSFTPLIDGYYLSILSLILLLRFAGQVTRMGETRNAYGILVEKPEGKIPLGRPRRRWVDNIKMDIREIGWDGVDWIEVAQDRDQWRALVNTVMNLLVS